MHIEDVKKMYRDEWLLLEVLEEDEKGTTKEVRLIHHSKNRQDIYDRLEETRGIHTMQFYNGKIPQQAYLL